MKGRGAHSLSMSALYTAIFHICLAASTALVPSPDSPIPDATLSASSPVTDSVSFISLVLPPIPGPESPVTKPGSPDSIAPCPAPSVKSPDTGLGPPTGVVFDVTHHGAAPDGGTESSMAFLATWDAACSHAGASTLYVPEGTYYVGPVSFSGPCYNGQSPAVMIKGTLTAPTSLKAFPDSKWIEFKDLNGIVVTGEIGETVFDARGAEEAWKQISCQKSSRCRDLVTSLKFSNVSHGNISNILLSNGKGFHVGFHESNNINISNIKIAAPSDSPNTDGIHISKSTNISIVSSKIGVGDDCVSIGPGSKGIFVYNVKCGPGHGISIGSLGKYKNEEDVAEIVVQNCTINGTQNGVRVKTWPGASASKAYNMTFKDIVMINVSNPIIIDQQYCPSHSCKSSEPSGVKISNIHYINITGTTTSTVAVDLCCSPQFPCKGIQLSNIKLKHSGGETKPLTSTCLNAGVNYSGVQFPSPCQ